MSSKEIAQQLGLSHRTVDQYINQAARLLGASNRREAARMLAFLEESALKKLQLKSQPVANPPISEEAEGVGQASDTGKKLPRILRWVPPIGGGRHDLKATEVTRDIFLVSLFSMVVATGIITAIFWLNKYFS